MLPVNNVFVFTVVVETGDINEAAKKLNVTSSVVNKCIQSLEEELDLTLFHKTANTIKLTNSGKLIYDKAKHVLSCVDEIKNLASIIQKEPIGTLRISCPVSVSSIILLPLLKVYLKEYPKMSIDLDVHDRPNVNFNKENVDILFGRSMKSLIDQEKNIVATKLFVTQHVLCASKNYLKEHGHPKSLSDLNDHHYIYHKSRLEDGFLVLCRLNNISIDTVLMVNTTEALVQAMELNMGLGLVPKFIVEKSIKRKEIVLLSSIYQEEPITIYMFYQKSRYQDPKIVQFRDFIIKKFPKWY